LYRNTKRHPTLGRGVVVGAGAKVLGGFEVGDGAKIGSNAVVIKPVPPGVTAVGNPAHILDSAHIDEAKTSAEPAAFSAYGVTKDMDDPLARAVQGLLEHATDTDRRFALLVARLAEADIKLGPAAESKDGFDAGELSKMVD
ncbi:MAG: serine O-acetyltransferase, partial [Azoarcus sp.]|nr:serine O-acetyltransferase [Azoarcus sp.]